MFPILQIGPLAMQTGPLFILLGMWLGLNLSEKYAKRVGLHPEVVFNVVFAALVSGVLGARLLYVLRYPAAFIASPGSLVSINPGLLDPMGGLAAALIAILIYGQRKQLPLWPTLDALTPMLATLAIAMALGNLATGRGFGMPTQLPWAIDLWGETRHPSQIYEGLAGVLVFWLVWRLPAKTTAPGAVFFVFLALSGGARLFLEAFRGDSATLANGLRVVQFAAWGVMAIGLGAAHKLQFGNPASPPEKAEIGGGHNG